MLRMFTSYGSVGSHHVSVSHLKTAQCCFPAARGCLFCCCRCEDREQETRTVSLLTGRLIVQRLDEGVILYCG